MRRGFGVITMLVGLLVASVAVATPAAAATSNVHFTASDRGAQALWSAEESGPGGGSIFTDTFIFTSQNAVNDDGNVFEDTFVFVDVFTYRFDRRGNFVPLSDTFGFAGGPDVTLSVDRQLTTATLEAVMTLTTCSFGRRGVCEDTEGVSIDAAWTGNGDLVRVSDHFHFKSGGFSEHFKFRGTFRPADATAKIGGSAPAGSLVFAEILDSSLSDIFICHGCE